jgi:N-acetylglutamate synthase/N-acetylornithine aminotransferase
MSKIQVWLGDVQICKDGGAAETIPKKQVRASWLKEITIRIDLGRGQLKTQFIPVIYLMTMSKLMPIIVRKYSL